MVFMFIMNFINKFTADISRREKKEERKLRPLQTKENLNFLIDNPYLKDMDYQNFY